jgi:CMP-N-acetylneuraminic acid synthetase
LVKKKEKIWAIIPARAGSKGLKNKNIRKIKNKHLIYYTINDAIKSKMFEKIFFLTDSKKYAKIAESYGAEVPFIRSKSNASDKSTDNDLYLNMLKIFKKKKIKTPNYFAHLSPTVPFRSNNIISKGIKFFFQNKKNNTQTMRSVNLYSPNAYKNVRVINNKLCSIIKKDFDVNKLNYPRQFYEKTFKPNGLIDIISKKNLELNKTTHGRNTLAFITDQVYTTDIDTNVDLMWVKFLLKNRLIKL